MPRVMTAAVRLMPGDRFGNTITVQNKMTKFVHVSTPVVVVSDAYLDVRRVCPQRHGDATRSPWN